MKQRIFLLLFLMTGFAGIAGAAEGDASTVFGNVKLNGQSGQPKADMETLRHEAFLTDSLLSTIEIDSLTSSVYAMFTPALNRPHVLGSLEDVQFQTFEIDPPVYSSLAGVIVREDSVSNIIYPTVLSGNVADPIPDWFKKSVRLQNQIHDASVRMMIRNPYTVEYADWNLPEPPRLPKEDFSFHAYLKRLHLPEIDVNAAILPEIEIKRKNWLHYFNVALQVSQAYVSANWYQGGNSYVAGLFNFTWNVDLNQVYHPNLLFQSSVQYKLAVNSNPKGSLHKYNTSQDLFQYTLKTGLKAFNHWFYSLNVLFNTQFFNAYPEDSKQRTSTLLSPGTLNIGLGMTYSLNKKGAALTVSISPLAYNLKTCVASDIDHLQFNIAQNKRTLSEIGSSAEANLTWKFTDNISWKSRLFLFTDYSYFLADWENTFNFQLNKFLSTQIYIHPRFDSSTEINASKWKHWMLREVLSFGVSYTFATPK